MSAPRNRTAVSDRAGGTAANWSAEPPLPPRNAPGADGVSLIGRYGICGHVSAGGMASIHLGFMLGSAGFSRVVALKRMHPGLAHDPEFADRFKHEVMLAARVRHPNVVQALDVIECQGELLLVMEFIHGENLAGLLKAANNAGKQLPLQVVLAVITSALHGLHAAHEAVDAEGAPLRLVHRDLSPQNVLIGSDGHARVLDFGVAKSSSQWVVTQAGHLAGKVPYMSPEQVRAEALDRRSDVFSVGVVLWEALTGTRLFGANGADSAATLLAVLSGPIAAPSEFRPIPAAVERAVLRALNRDPKLRFASARDFALELEATGSVAGPTMVASCVQNLCAERLQQLTDLQALASRALLSAQRSAAANDEAIPASQSAGDEAAPPVSQRVPPSDDAERANDGDALPPPEVAQSSIQSGTRSTPRRAAGVILTLLLATALGALLLGRMKASPAAVVITQIDPPAVLNRAGTAPPAPAPPVQASEPAVEPVAPGSLATTRPRVAGVTGISGVTSAQPRRATPPVCAQPTYLDERGIRHFKPQCL